MRALTFPLPTLPVVLLALILLPPAVALAEISAEPASPASIAFVDGTVLLDRESSTDAATVNLPFLPGDRLRAARGRIEISFPDGSVLDLDEYSTVELQAPTLLRVSGGRVLLMVAGAGSPASAIDYRIDTPQASVTTNGPGEYRVAVRSGPTGSETELAVLRGVAELTTERGTTPLRAGERSTAWGEGAPSAPQPFNSARFDAFDEWAAARRDGRLGSQSARYLPAGLRMYGGTLDRYGAWEYQSPYGYVWYPSVAADWRPYYTGYWSSIPPYGWFWIGADMWSWPTHHYGRWGYGGRRWFWIPDRRWAPAWVSWGAAPGYVSWCALGFDGRPVFSLTSGVGVGTAWAGWVVVPRTHFGVSGRLVQHDAVTPRTLPAGTPFITQASAPVPPRAVPRRELHAARGNLQDLARTGAVLGGSGAAQRASTGTERAVSRPGSSRREPLAPGSRASDKPSHGLSTTRPAFKTQLMDRSLARRPSTPAAPAPAVEGAPASDAMRRTPSATGGSWRGLRQPARADEPSAHAQTGALAPRWGTGPMERPPAVPLPRTRYGSPVSPPPATAVPRVAEPPPGSATLSHGRPQVIGPRAAPPADRSRPAPGPGSGPNIAVPRTGPRGGSGAQPAPPPPSVGARHDAGSRRPR
jgi:hypothetical protein